MEYIFLDTSIEKKTKSTTLQSLLGNKIVLENVHKHARTRFTSYNQFLNGMNSFHLICRYYPEAIEIIHETFCNNEDKLDDDDDKPVMNECMTELRKFVQEKNEREYTPVHIAAQKSLLQCSR